MDANFNKKRPPALAGSWYPSDPRRLEAQIELYLEQARNEGARPTQQPSALVVPHAGLVYSGLTAAHAFLSVQEAPNRVILMGPAHRVGFQGISAGTYSHYSCPLGDLPVDRKAIEKLLLDGLVSSRLEAHHEEHCLEMMLPFIISLWGKVPILPFLVSRAQPAEVTHLLEELCRAGDLICISSDLSHFLTYDKARVRDFHTLDTITDGRWDELGPHDACGYTAIAGLIKLAERRNLVASRLDYRNSGDTGGDRDRVVGYGALAYTPVDSK